jgi:DNA replication and repair protein RecF
MIIRKLNLQNFRNFAQLELTFSTTTNFFHGRNAQGKSNLLEAIYCLSLTRGFRAGADQELLKFGAESFEVAGEYVDEHQSGHLLAISYRQAQGKQIRLDRKRLSSYTALVGKFPIVLFSPESHRITAGPPAERRRFMDVLLSQGSSVYLADLQEYNRILRQRNALLAQSRSFHPGARAKSIKENRGTNTTDRTLSAWDESLAFYGCKIIQARYQFVRENAQILQQAYEYISASSHSLQFAYRSQIDSDDISSERFLKRLDEHRVREKQRAQTLVGPHRDDLDLRINGIDLRRFGSRGEHKSALMALKMMEADYLKQRLNTAPIILLDDLISELDEARRQRCLRFFSGRGQLFISAVSVITDPTVENAVRFQIQDGNVTRMD